MALSENVNHLVYTVDNDLISTSALNTDESLCCSIAGFHTVRAWE